jgi:putative mRNA 3-end processing factor
MKIQVLGAGREVGKSAILLESRDSSLLMDYGLKIEPEPPQYAPMLDKEPNGVAISHAHLDHVGALPQLFNKWKPPVYMTDITMELTRLLIKDSIKIADQDGHKIPFSIVQLRKALKNTKLVNYGEPFSVKKLRVMFYNAGHIPGSAAISVHADKNVLYTGDIQTDRMHLVESARFPKKTDILITESTYAEKPHLNREKQEKKLVDAVEEAIANNTRLLLPTFAVGRSQEVLMILEKYAKYIYLDGMAKKATGLITSYPARIKNAKKLMKVANRINWVKTEKQRIAAVKKAPIIISSAGMLGGGPGVRYLKAISAHKENKVMFTGFQVPGSPGWGILDRKVYEHEGKRFAVKCAVDQVELSAHSGRNGLIDIVKKTNPKTVICVHGEYCEKFAKYLRSMGIDAFAPRNGETIRI